MLFDIPVFLSRMVQYSTIQLNGFLGYLFHHDSQVSSIDIRVDRYITWISSYIDFCRESIEGWCMYLGALFSETRFSSL